MVAAPNAAAASAVAAPPGECPGSPSDPDDCCLAAPADGAEGARGRALSGQGSRDGCTALPARTTFAARMGGSAERRRGGSSWGTWGKAEASGAAVGPAEGPDQAGATAATSGGRAAVGRTSLLARPLEVRARRPAARLRRRLVLLVRVRRGLVVLVALRLGMSPNDVCILPLHGAIPAGGARGRAREHAPDANPRRSRRLRSRRAANRARGPLQLPRRSFQHPARGNRALRAPSARQWFLMALSVLPGSSLAIVAHLSSGRKSDSPPWDHMPGGKVPPQSDEKGVSGQPGWRRTCSRVSSAPAG